MVCLTSVTEKMKVSQESNFGFLQTAVEFC